MKNSNTANRLRQIMTELGIERQVDLLNLVAPYCKEYGVKMNKSDISQYLSGKNQPTQSKLFVLSAALNVSEGWLMGFDVPMERPSDAERFAKTADAINKRIQFRERQHLEAYRRLSAENKNKIDKMTAALLDIQDQETEILLAAHERTDVDGTVSEKEHDLNIMDKF